MSQELIDAVNELTAETATLLVAYVSAQNSINSKVTASAESAESASESAESASASAVESADYVKTRQYIAPLGGMIFLLDEQA